MSDLKLHLGCGKKRLPGWINVDIRPDVNPDLVADVRDLSQIKTNSVQEIYYCHGLEHLKYVEVQPALLEWKRVLKPNGVLRLSVPDMGILTEMYYEDSADLKMIRGAISGGQEYPSNIHYSVWDWATLENALALAQYTDIDMYYALGWLAGIFGTGRLQGVYFDWSIGEIAGREISLNVEARA